MYHRKCNEFPETDGRILSAGKHCMGGHEIEIIYSDKS